MKKYLSLLCSLLGYVSLSFSQTTLYSQNFNGSLNGCTSVDNNGSSGAWIWASDPINSPSFGAVQFNSPTAYNGFALILSDGNNSALNTDLILPAIDCSSSSYVALQFYYFLAIYNSAVATVSVSTDSLNWNQIFDAVNYVENNGALDPWFFQMNISAYAANQPKVYIKFNYQATNDDWWAIDDISVTALPANDVQVDSVVIPDYASANSWVPVSAMLTNWGGQTLSNLQLTYAVGNATPVTQTFSGLNLATFGSTSVQFDIRANLDSVAAYPITISSTLPNSTTDANLVNDTAVKSIVTLSQVPFRNVLLEEFTTANCGWCPGGETDIEQIMASADSTFVIPVELHAGLGTDAMTTPEDNTLCSDLDQGAPLACIDRELYDGNNGIVAVEIYQIGNGLPNIWKDDAETEHTVASPVDLSATNTYDSSTREVTVTVTSKFYGPATGNFRMDCYIIEDSVVGSGSGYDQISYYYSSPVGNPYYEVGNYSSTNQEASIPGFVHHHVERGVMNGIWGTGGIIPSTTTDGGTYTQTFQHVLGASWRTDFITLAAFVNNYNNDFSSEKNIVLNSVAMRLNSSASTVATAIRETSANDLVKINLYPNPATDRITLAYSLSQSANLSFDVYDMLGQFVSSSGKLNCSEGNHSINISTSQLANGLYFVELKNDSGLLQTLKFVVAK